MSYQQNIKKLAVYPDCNTGSLPAISYTIIGLAGEVGETSNKFKKVLRGDKTLEEAKEGISKELGGVFWYLYQLCNELGLKAEDIMDENFKTLTNRLNNNTIRGDGDNR